MTVTWHSMCCMMSQISMSVGDTWRVWRTDWRPCCHLCSLLLSTHIPQVWMCVHLYPLFPWWHDHYPGDAIKYVQVFTDIERTDQLRKYYIGSHKASPFWIGSDILVLCSQGSVLELWTSLHSPSKPLLSYLSTFYDELLDKWHTEVGHCTSVSTASIMLSCSLAGVSKSLWSHWTSCLLYLASVWRGYPRH